LATQQLLELPFLVRVQAGQSIRAKSKNESRKMEKFTAVVLAAGKGVRMKSSLPKVLHDLEGKSILYYVLRELKALNKYVKQIIVVVGHKGDLVKKSIRADFSGIDFVTQKDLSGTASAIKCVKNKVKNNNVLILCGDAPLITKETLEHFISFSLKKKLSASLVTAYINGKNELGSVIRDSKGWARAITEEIDLDKPQLGKEVNSGIYCFKRKVLFDNLSKIKKNKRKKEYFLTDILEILYKKGIKALPFLLDDSQEVLGINNRRDLGVAAGVIRQRVLDAFLEKGVKIIDPATTFIQEGVKIGQNSVIYPFTFIEKDVIIGSNCFLGPFLHLRPGTRVADNTDLGNFLEVKGSKIGKRVKMKHFAYVGDAVISDDVNVGAGTVVANFDGKLKHKTYIKKRAFIGSDTVLVAPVTVGEAGVTGAGSVVTKNVAARKVVVGVPARVLKKKKRG
jgi:bifunctional UDP-N-acetylglucosamine pyrophosphorylase/glucosamine-1-phosphate N-acetyltransferase